MTSLATLAVPTDALTLILQKAKLFPDAEFLDPADSHWAISGH